MKKAVSLNVLKSKETGGIDPFHGIYAPYECVDAGTLGIEGWHVTCATPIEPI